MASKANVIINVDTIAELVNFVNSKPLMFCLEDKSIYGWNGSTPEKAVAKTLPKYEPVQWVKVLNGRTEGLRLVCLSSNAFTSGASSYQKIINKGSVKLLANNVVNRDMSFGLSYIDANAHFNTINFAITINSGTDNIQIYELGTLIGTYGTWASRDLEIVRNNLNIEYFANGVSLRQTVCTNQPVVVDTSLYLLNSAFNYLEIKVED